MVVVVQLERESRPGGGGGVSPNLELLNEKKIFCRFHLIL